MTKLVPAVAVIRVSRALSGFTGRKEFVGGLLSFSLNPQGLTLRLRGKLIN